MKRSLTTVFGYMKRGAGFYRGVAALAAHLKGQTPLSPTPPWQPQPEAAGGKTPSP